MDLIQGQPIKSWNLSMRKKVILCLPAVTSLIFLFSYVSSIKRFRGGDIPGLEYVIAIVSPVIVIPIGIIYFLRMIIKNNRKKLNHFHIHLTSSLTMICSSSLIVIGVWLGYYVSV